MSEGTTSFVGTATGPTHTGQGDQFNVTVVADAVRRLLDKARDRRSVARDDLTWLYRRFVEPPNHGTAAGRLADTGCVLLTGSGGSGRHAAARMLLYRLPEPYVPIQDVPLGPDDDPLDGSRLQPGDRLLGDLSDADDERFRDLLPALSSYRAQARERDAHLVLVLRTDQERDVPPELGRFVVRMGRPDGMSVLRRHLTVDGTPYTDEQLAVPGLLPHLAATSIGVLADLAKWIRAARELAAPGSGFADWLASALATCSDQDGAVALQVARVNDGRRRALLLACAMLSDASPDAVHETTGRLLSVLGHPPDDRPALEQPSVAELFADIDVRTDHAGRVRFRTLDYDRAVRTHFWTNYPGLRAQLRDWVGEIARLPVLDDRSRDDVVDRFAEQALRLDRPDDLVLLIRQWADRPGSLEQAARALERGLGHHRYGGVFRQRVYQWSREQRLSAGLVGVLVRACADVLVLTHPDQALVRLHHLARRQGGVARDTLLDLAQDDLLCRRLLARLSDIITRGAGWPADARLFLDLAEPARLTREPRPLIGSAVVRADLTVGWAAVLTQPPPFWADHVRQWLDRGAARPYREWLVTVLVDAARGRAAVFGRLYVVARDWARAPGEDRATRIEIADLLSARIDSAQGIQETTR